MAMTPPNCMVANNCGIQIKVRPVAAGPLVCITSRTSPWLMVEPRIANTVPKIIRAASNETKLLPNPVMNEFLTTPCLACM